MSSKNPAQRLRDIIDNIDAIRAFTADMSLGDFARDRKTVYAVTRALEIISEAARRLPDDLKLRNPGIDWTAVAAAGNVYRHEYEVVDEALVWYTVQHSLTDLHDASAAEIRRLTEEGLE
jgi:uncharacterized protein with HEPN domain